MDGGGRLARSLTTRWPRSNPKPAADFGGRLLPARPSARSRHEMSQLPLRDGSTPKLILQIERRLPRRFGIAATIALLVGTLGFGVVKGGHLAKVGETLSDTRNALANAAGFRITSLSIVGRKQLSQEEVLAIGGVNGRSSLLFLNAAEVRDKLKASPWIADATVLKLYPGRLSIEITERKAFALWQQGGRMSVIAEDGAVLEPYVARRFTNLPLVVGKGAETHARDFLALLAQFPQIKPDVKAVIYVGERRWNLRMNSGLDIRLPEHGVANALTTLTRLDKEDKLLSRDITAIDMRLPDRLTVRLSEEAGKARDELFKKSKRKGTDA